MNEPVRVLQVIGIMNRGGAEEMIMNLYRHVDRRKVQFDFVENENKGAFFDEEIRDLGGKIYHCPRFNGKNLFTYIKWWKDFFGAHSEYRIIHGHIGSTASIYLREAEKNGLITIAHSHNIYSNGKKHFLYKILSYPTRYIADYFFMCSHQAGVDRFGARTVFDANKAYLVPNAINTSHFQFNESIRAKKRKELEINEDLFLVGHVGRFTDQKNHSYLLEVFKHINQLVPSSKLILVGDGELRSKIKKKTDLMGLSRQVFFAGIRSDVNELMMAMDVMIFPSKFEGLPVTLVEAQCTGLPCIISDTIPSDSILIKEVVQVCALSDNVSTWAKRTINHPSVNRFDCAARIKDAGFDAERSARWLEEFYLEKAK